MLPSGLCRLVGLRSASGTGKQNYATQQDEGARHFDDFVRD